MCNLKKIGPLSAARVAGFIAAVFYALSAGILIALGKTGNIDVTSSNGVVTLALGIVLSSVAGVILGAAGALLYNLLGRRGRGLRLQFRLLETPADDKPEDKK